MTYATRNLRPGRSIRPLRGQHRHFVAVHAPADPLWVAEPRVAPVTAPPLVWPRSVRRFAGVAIWALPAYVLMLGAVTLLRVPDPRADFAGYAAYVTTDRFRLAALAAMLGAGLSLVALVALAALLAGRHGGRTAGAALLAGIGAVAIGLPLSGLGAYAQPAIGWAFLRGDTGVAVAVNEGTYGSAAALAGAAAAASGTLAWLLAGLAVQRARVLNPADGVLFMVGAPIVSLGGTLAEFLPTIGALLLLAGALGLAWSATRLASPI